TQHGNGDHLIRRVWERSRRNQRIGNPLPQPLMGSSMVEVHDIRFEKAIKLLLLEDQEVIQAFSSHTSQKAFTDGIGAWRPVRRSKDFDATCCGHLCKMLPEFAIIIPDQVRWGLPIRSGLPQLDRKS